MPAGYAVVNINLPGYANSDGPPSAFTEHQGKCYFEAIEWIANQPWCSGKVGLNGVSFLAISQFHVAACQSYGGPHLLYTAFLHGKGLLIHIAIFFALVEYLKVAFPHFGGIRK